MKNSYLYTKAGRGEQKSLLGDGSEGEHHQTNSTTTTQELDRNASCQPNPSLTESETLGLRPFNLCYNKPSE